VTTGVAAAAAAGGGGRACGRGSPGQDERPRLQVLLYHQEGGDPRAQGGAQLAVQGSPPFPPRSRSVTRRAGELVRACGSRSKREHVRAPGSAVPGSACLGCSYSCGLVVYEGLKFVPEVRISIICWVPVRWNLQNSARDWAALPRLDCLESGRIWV
jgi:hypothetical protein